MVKTCTFFGHRVCSEDIKPKLYDVLKNLILEKGVAMFYVGNQGQFDAYVRSTLRCLGEEFPYIRYAVVLAYMPGKPSEYDADTMLPEGIEQVYPRFAISWRNDWMLQRSEYVVTYVTHTWGGAYQSACKAKKQKKTVISLGEISGVF